MVPPARSQTFFRQVVQGHPKAKVHRDHLMDGIVEVFNGIVDQIHEVIK
jgi:hypothetical protein